MRGRHAVALLLVCFCQGSFGQTSDSLQEHSQTARQALLEMLFPVGPFQFLNHLPTGARSVLKLDPDLLPMQAVGQFLGPLQMPGRKLETFDSGPILLRSENPYTKRTVEVVVDSESDGVDEDEMQLTPHLYDAGKPRALPFVLKLSCVMNRERGVWRLADFGVDLHVPLADQAFLEALSGPLRPEPVEAMEAQALNHLRTLSSAEVNYAAMFPDLGFTCSLSDLGGPQDQEEPSPSAAMLIDPALATGRVQGYTFSLEGCTGSPVDHFYIVASPENAGTDQRAFCTDESAMIRFSEDGDATTCVSAGELVP